MGYALARAAQEEGALVTLVSGPVHLSPPEGVSFHSVITAQAMYEKVMEDIQEQDIFIGVAAVADYRPLEVHKHKRPKSEEDIMLHLTPNPDILSAVAALLHPPFTIGFAAQTHDVISKARKEAGRKKVNIMVANEVGLPGQGFGVDTHTFTALWKKMNVISP